MITVSYRSASDVPSKFETLSLGEVSFHLQPFGTLDLCKNRARILRFNYEIYFKALRS